VSANPLLEATEAILGGLQAHVCQEISELAHIPWISKWSKISDQIVIKGKPLVVLIQGSVPNIKTVHELTHGASGIYTFKKTQLGVVESLKESHHVVVIDKKTEIKMLQDVEDIIGTISEMVLSKHIKSTVTNKIVTTVGHICNQIGNICNITQAFSAVNH
jgi:hypothetical protein